MRIPWQSLHSPGQGIIPASMSTKPIHIVGGGLAGSEAAWQAAQAGVPVILHEMRPVRGTDAHKTDGPRRTGLLELLPLGRRRDQRGRPASCRDAACRLADHERRRRQPGAGRRRACRRPRRLLRRRHRAARGAPADHHRARGSGRAAAGRLGPGDHRHRPADRARRWPRRSRPSTGADALAFFDAIAPIVHFDTHRHGHLLVPVALRQGRPRRHRQGLHQLPDGQGAVRSLRRRRCSTARRPNSRNGKARPISTAACRSR